MKNTFTSLLLGLILVGLSHQSFAQTFESRVVENDMGYLVYQMRETSGVGTPTTTTDISDITFVIRWQTTLSTDMDLICTTNDYSIIDGDPGLHSYLTYSYRYWNGNIASPIHPPHDWTEDVWEDIAIFKTTTGSGSGDFEVAPDGDDGRSLNWAQGDPPVSYTPTINGNLSNYTYPTLVYDYVWVGGFSSSGFWDEESWTYAGNWLNECGGTVSSGPSVTNNCFIPNGQTYYPANASILGVFPSNSLNVRIGLGGAINWNDQHANNNILDILGNLDIYGTMNIKPNAAVTVTGNTYIDAAQGLVVQATTDSVGSFIDNGTITYGTSAPGTAKVQTFVSNGAVVGTFYMHLMGPTLDEENYTGAGTGAFLQAFDVAPNTYAYSWSELNDVWVNEYSNT